MIGRSSRREFIGRCAAAAACVPVRIWGAAADMGEPDLRLGVLSDIHIRIAPGAKTDPTYMVKDHSKKIKEHLFFLMKYLVKKE